jgi:anti-sigma B factor antagonist
MPGIDDLFRADLRHLDGNATVELHGELDVYTAPTFRELALKLLQDGHSRIVLDAARLTFIDSTGIGLFVSVMRRAEADGGFVRVTGANGPVARALEITGLAQRLGGIGHDGHTA